MSDSCKNILGEIREIVIFNRKDIVFTESGMRIKRKYGKHKREGHKCVMPQPYKNHTDNNNTAH